MTTARALKSSIEAKLANKAPAALSPAPRLLRRVTPTGIQTLDSLLGGGLPQASITELVGWHCSGRTTVAFAFLASIAQAGNVCAWIDVANAFDPETAAAHGIDLERLLWVRCGVHSSLQTAQEIKHRAPSSIGGLPSQPRHTGGGSPHPRSEGKDMPQAIVAMLHAHGGLYDKQVRRERRHIGTPGAPNRLLSCSVQREEQVNSDRLPPRRGENLTIAARCAEPQPRRVASRPSGETVTIEAALPKAGISPANKPWQSLDQALRATDLLLQGGGFSAIVLDLGSTPAEIAWRIPMATWFRYRAVCERTRVSLLLLTQHPCARSSAELVVRLEPGSMEAESKVMTGIRYGATVERNRANEDHARVVPIRKPPQSERKCGHPGEWKSEAAWARAR